MNNIVVLGASGFIGRHLVTGLASDKKNKIVAFDRFSSYDGVENTPFDGVENVEIFIGDFSNRNDLARVTQGADYVFHMVSSTNPAASSKDPFIDIDMNVRSSIELFEICADNGVEKVIFPSSGGTVYGNKGREKISENSAPEPRSPYGIGKITIEHYLRYFKYTHGLDYIVYRIANPYGPGQNIFGKQGVIPIFMHKVLTEEPVTVYGDGTMVRDYIYIDDLISMMVQTYDKNCMFNEYNLGSGSGTSINSLIDSIEQCTDRRVEKIRLETPSTFVQKSVLDIDRFITEFGMPRFTKLEDGMRKTWEYVKQLR